MPDAEAHSGPKRLAVVGPSAASALRLRGKFIETAIALGHTVKVFSPQTCDGSVAGLHVLGADAAPIMTKPESFSLWPGRVVLRGLEAQIRDFAPHALLAYGRDTVPLAVRAARRAEIARIVVLISELESPALPRPLRRVLDNAHAIVAHNADDFRILAASGLKTRDRSVVRLPGSGADLAAYDGLPVPPLDGDMVFLMVASLVAAKGVAEFCEAAERLRSDRAPAKFILAGLAGAGPTALPPETLARYALGTKISLLGPGADLRPLLAEAHVVVAPSYREGMAYPVLQALAAGRATVVSDIPGNRETTDEMVNGTLVPPRDATALAAAFSRMLKHKDMIPVMGRASRTKAERHFSAVTVNAALADALGLT